MHGEALKNHAERQPPLVQPTLLLRGRFFSRDIFGRAAGILVANSSLPFEIGKSRFEAVAVENYRGGKLPPKAVGSVDATYELSRLLPKGIMLTLGQDITIFE
jgi:hypothetical protein